MGINELRKVLAKLAAGMSSVQQRIEPEWARVRRRLEEMQKTSCPIATTKICAEEGVESVEDQETLAKILNYLGIALNYRGDPRRDTSVLKPRWLVDGIYSVLRWLHCK